MRLLKYLQQMLGEACHKVNIILFIKCFSIQQYKSCVTGRKVTMNSVHLKSERDCQDLIDGDEEKTCKRKAVVQGAQEIVN
jgi:hypothetical protein